MRDQRENFVLLHYVPTRDLKNRGSIPVLVLQEEEKIGVYLRSGWQTGLSQEDCDYLGGLTEDWLRLTTPESQTLLTQLAELSTGPLRAIEAGRVEAKQRQDLIARVASDD
jgi:hypothetical protein